MEDELPLPLPDRRVFKANNDSSRNVKSHNKRNNNEFTQQSKNSEQKFNELKESKLSVMSSAQIMQIEDMRQKILTYKLLSDKMIYLNNNNHNLHKCNIIIFGPPGGGKSSFIKSLYRSLYNISYIPSESINKLLIRNKYKNEGALLFNQFHFVIETENNNGIMICDTRGHLKINNDEEEQNKILFNGEIRDDQQIQQIVNKNEKALIEFWKKSDESFPKEIFKEKYGDANIKSIPHSVVFIFDGSTDEIIKKEDTDYYRELILISKNKGYKDIHVILSNVDKFGEKIYTKYKHLPETEILSKLKIMIDIQIEKVILLLGVKRSNVHFIENYHSDNQKTNSTEIDYNVLKTIIDILNSSELFILDKLNKTQNCFGFCL